MSLAHIPDPAAHPPVILPPAPLAPKALPRIHLLKYLPLPILIIGLSITLYAVNTTTNTSSQASNTCPLYNISPLGDLSPQDLPAGRQVQITINGSPMILPITVPTEGIHTWQVIDNFNCTSAGSYTPTSSLKPNTESQPLLIPTLAK